MARQGDPIKQLLIREAFARKRERQRAQQRMAEKVHDYKLRLQYEKEKSMMRAAMPAAPAEVLPGFGLKQYTSGGKTFIKEAGPKEDKGLQKARDRFDIYTSDVTQIMNALDKIERQARKLGDFKRGLLSQTGARIKTGLGAFAMDEDINKFIIAVQQELIPMARKVMEEKGPITEWDVGRIEKGLGQLTAPLEDKMFALDEFRNKVRGQVKNKAEVAGFDDAYLQQNYPDLYGKLNSFSMNSQPEGKSIIPKATEQTSPQQSGYYKKYPWSQ